MANQVSELFDANIWHEVPGFGELTDVTYHKHMTQGIVRIAFNRPEVRNAFRPRTVDELARSLQHAAEDSRVGVILLTGNGPSPKDGVWAFSSGGDQRVRGQDGYKYADGDDAASIDQPATGACTFSRFSDLFVLCQR
jgi:naphthoate synthase